MQRLAKDDLLSRAKTAVEGSGLLFAVENGMTKRVRAVELRKGSLWIKTMEGWHEPAGNAQFYSLDSANEYEDLQRKVSKNGKTN